MLWGSCRKLGKLTYVTGDQCFHGVLTGKVASLGGVLVAWRSFSHDGRRYGNGRKAVTLNSVGSRAMRKKVRWKKEWQS